MNLKTVLIVLTIVCYIQANPVPAPADKQSMFKSLRTNLIALTKPVRTTYKDVMDTVTLKASKVSDSQQLKKLCIEDFPKPVKKALDTKDKLCKNCVDLKEIVKSIDEKLTEYVTKAEKGVAELANNIKTLEADLTKSLTTLKYKDTPAISSLLKEIMGLMGKKDNAKLAEKIDALNVKLLELKSLKLDDKIQKQIKKLDEEIKKCKTGLIDSILAYFKTGSDKVKKISKDYQEKIMKNSKKPKKVIDEKVFSETFEGSVAYEKLKTYTKNAINSALPAVVVAIKATIKLFKIAAETYLDYNRLEWCSEIDSQIERIANIGQILCNNLIHIEEGYNPFQFAENNFKKHVEVIEKAIQNTDKYDKLTSASTKLRISHIKDHKYYTTLFGNKEMASAKEQFTKDLESVNELETKCSAPIIEKLTKQIEIKFLKCDKLIPNLKISDVKRTEIKKKFEDCQKNKHYDLSCLDPMFEKFLVLLNSKKAYSECVKKMATESQTIMAAEVRKAEACTDPDTITWFKNEFKKLIANNKILEAGTCLIKKIPGVNDYFKKK